MNESGKSNALKALGLLKIFGDNRSLFSKENQNLNSNKAASYCIHYCLRDDEALSWNYDEIDRTTVLLLTGIDSCSVTGAIARIYINSLQKDILNLVSIFSKYYKPSGTEFNDYNSKVNEFKKDDNFNIIIMNSTFNNFRTIYTNNIPADIKPTILFEDIVKKWDSFKELFPNIYFHSQDIALKTEYTAAEVSSALTNADEPLTKYVNLIHMEHKAFYTAVSVGNDDQRINLRQEIIDKTNSLFNDPFKNFYKTEEICLSPQINDGKIKFCLKSNQGKIISLSERSNGIRWYINLYIDILSNNLAPSNTLYVLDEPGIYLHVNAQKEGS